MGIKCRSGQTFELMGRSASGVITGPHAPYHSKLRYVPAARQAAEKSGGRRPAPPAAAAGGQVAGIIIWSSTIA